MTLSMTDSQSIECSALEYDRGTIRAAIRAFRNHELIEGDEFSRRWRIATKYENGSIQGQYATEVVSLWGGRLYAGGDISDCVFAYYSDTKEGNLNHHAHKLCWIGRGQDVSYYIAQKATIGLTDGGKITETWDEDVARFELREALNDKDHEWSDSDREAMEGAIELCGDGEEWVMIHLYENLSDPYYVPSNLGKVTACRVIYAWAACRKLCQLLWGPNPTDRYAKYDTDNEEEGKGKINGNQ